MWSGCGGGGGGAECCSSALSLFFWKPLSLTSAALLLRNLADSEWNLLTVWICVAGDVLLLMVDWNFGTAVTTTSITSLFQLTGSTCPLAQTSTSRTRIEPNGFSSFAELCQSYSVVVSESACHWSRKAREDDRNESKQMHAKTSHRGSTKGHVGMPDDSREGRQGW